MWCGMAAHWQPWGLPVQRGRVSFEPSLTIRALHLQEPEIFSFLRKSAILASLLRLRSGVPPQSCLYLPATLVNALPWGILGVVL